MSVSLSKGGNVSLSKAAPSMKNVLGGPWLGCAFNRRSGL